MRSEIWAKISILKRLAHPFCNFRNICKTMISRHQLQQYVHWTSSSDLVTFEFCPGKLIPYSALFSDKDCKVLEKKNVLEGCKISNPEGPKTMEFEKLWHCYYQSRSSEKFFCFFSRLKNSVYQRPVRFLWFVFEGCWLKRSISQLPSWKIRNTICF